MKVKFVKELSRDLQFGVPLMVIDTLPDGSSSVSPTIYINTEAGFLGVDIEVPSEVGYSACSIFAIPRVSGEIFDIARARIIDEHDALAPIQASFFGDIFTEDPTVEALFEKADIAKAFGVDEE